MPMKEENDYPLGDMTKDYCVHCADTEGNLKSYEEVLKEMAGFMSEMKNIPFDEAEKQAKVFLKTMPAWKNNN